jgi:hypothetical protein
VAPQTKHTLAIRRKNFRQHFLMGQTPFATKDKTRANQPQIAYSRRFDGNRRHSKVKEFAMEVAE